MRTDALRLVGMSLLVVTAGCFALRKPAGQKQPATPRLSSVPLVEDDPPPKIEPPPMPKPPAKTTAANKDASTLRTLADRAVAAERSLTTYNVRLRRRERTKDVEPNTEIIALRFRRAPYSIHFKWLGDEAHGREVLYVKGQNEGKVLLLTGPGDFIGPPIRLAFAPESPAVRAKFRYDINEAGLNAAVLQFATSLDAIERKAANAGSMQYLGQQVRPEFPKEMEAVEQQLPSGSDSLLPHGGTRFFYFDTRTGLPMLVQTFDEQKREVEYYCFDRLQTPVALDDADFDPSALWPKRK